MNFKGCRKFQIIHNLHSVNGAENTDCHKNVFMCSSCAVVLAAQPSGKNCMRIAAVSQQAQVKLTENMNCVNLL